MSRSRPVLPFAVVLALGACSDPSTPQGATTSPDRRAPGARTPRDGRVLSGDASGGPRPDAARSPNAPGSRADAGISPDAPLPIPAPDARSAPDGAGASAAPDASVPPARCPPVARAGAGTATRAAPIAGLQAGHPRLLVTGASLARTRALIEAGDPVAVRLLDALRRKVESIYPAPLVRYEQDGSTANRLTSSPVALDRILALAGYALLTDDARAAGRARDEMLAAAAFPDWHPPHFLDTAVMAHALAIGYDWLFPRLTPAERASIRRALVELGLRPGLAEYTRRTWWTTSAFNWPLVCASGLGIAALAVADEEPALAADVLGRSIAALDAPLATYAPDGAWPEGPMYWAYGTTNLVALLGALETALGTDLGLSTRPGLAATGGYRLALVGPTNKFFSFGDTGESAGNAELTMWLGRRFGVPLYPRAELARDALTGPRALLGYEPACTIGGELPAASTAYERLGVAVLRARWEDPRAAYVGFKGGDNTTPHGHLDLGSFVLDLRGKRWAVDLGSDAYTIPGYFDAAQRWGLYRLRTEGHNTLAVAPARQTAMHLANQSTTARAPLVAFSADPARSRAVVDLTAAYGATRALRGIALVDGEHVLVVDELAARAPVDVVWQLHTRATVTTSGTRATLVDGAETLLADVLEPADAHFEQLSADPSTLDPATPQNHNAGVTNLVVRLPTLVASTRIVVWLRPAGVSGTAPAAPPLSTW